MTVEFSSILAEGIEVWNEWREENPHMQPDFSDTVFSPIQRQFNKSFHQVLNLSGASFRNAGLQHSSFLNSNLIRADFRDAELAYTRFNGADLTDADLSHLDLTGVDFSDAILENTDLSGSDLSEVKNVSREQILSALGDESTVLPAYMVTPAHWTETADSVDNIQSNMAGSDEIEHEDPEAADLATPVQRKKLLHRPMWLGGILLAIFSGIFVVTDAVLDSSSSENHPVALLSYEATQPKQVKKAKSNKEPSQRKQSDKAQSAGEPEAVRKEEVISSGTASSNGSSSSSYYYTYAYGREPGNTESNAANSDELDSGGDTTLVLDTNTEESLSGFLQTQQKAERRKRLQRAFDNSVDGITSGNTQSGLPSGTRPFSGNSLSSGNLSTGSTSSGNSLTSKIPVAGKLLGR